MSGIDTGVKLSRREREIAIEALATRAAGSPVEAAKDLLAAIAILDGEHLPLAIWPASVTTHEEKASWHEQQAAYWQRRATRLQLLKTKTSSADQSQLSGCSSAEEQAAVELNLLKAKLASLEQRVRELGFTSPKPLLSEA